jgi:hypothetical protein
MPASRVTQVSARVVTQLQTNARVTQVSARAVGQGMTYAMVSQVSVRVVAKEDPDPIRRAQAFIMD